MKFISELSKETLICSELKVKDYKELLKCSFGDEPNQLIFIETLTDIFSKLTNKPQEYFKEELSVVDLFCLLLDIRMNSLGDTTKVLVTNEGKQMGLELRLDYIREELMETQTKLSFLTIPANGCEIVLECPSVKRLLDQTEKEYLPFISKINFLNKSSEQKQIKVKTNKDSELFLEKLSPKNFLKIIDGYHEIVTTLVSTNFLARYRLIQQLFFTPSVNSLLWFTKLMFNEGLETFYENVFSLSLHANMNTDYIENCTVGEYKLFSSQLRAFAASQNETNDESFSEEDHEFDDGFSEEPV